MFQDGLVHIYDLQTGKWISGFQAAAGIGTLSFNDSLILSSLCLHLMIA